MPTSVCSPKSKKSCGEEECPTCPARSLASVSHVNAWSPRNGDTRPIDILKGSRRRIWRTCSTCEHEYELAAYNDSWEKLCPYCSEPPKKLCDAEDCESCFAKSFASHPHAHEWDYTRNTTTPRTTFLYCNDHRAFTCRTCNHPLDIAPCDIMQGQWCSFCAHQRLCENSNCGMCFENSFASHEKAAFWSALNQDSPRQVFKRSSRTKCWFDCPICLHPFEAIISDITNGSWCGYCSTPPKHLCDDGSCDKCFAKSFASHPKAVHWHEDNPKTARQTFLNSNHHCKFRCDVCPNVWSTPPANVNVGTWCPKCKHKTEKIVLDYLSQHLTDVQYQVKFDWCVWPQSGRKLSFDFVLQNVIIELDGDQHFIQVGNWTSPERTRERDLYRMKTSLQEGFSTIRILQRDVSLDKYDWKTELLNAIRQCLSVDAPCLVFLSKKGEYDEMRSQVEV
jgi:hypothetical protein